MQYEIKFKYEGVIGTYYMPLVSKYELSKQEITYSARMIVAKFLGIGQFDIISIRECV
jgi:hypothetical protein